MLYSFRVMIGAALAFTLQTSAAHAVIVSYTMSGTVDDIGAGDTTGFRQILPFAIGDTISIESSFDTDTADGAGNINFGYFPSSGDIFIRIANSKTSGMTTFFLDGTSASRTVNDHPTLPDRLTHGIDFNYSDFVNSDPGISYSEVGNATRTFSGFFELADSTKMALATDQLPADEFTLSDFDTARWSISDAAGSGAGSTWTTGLGSNFGQSHRIEGSITSLTVTVASVPEPSLYALGCVLTSMVTLRRRSRAH